ncbi:MAG: DUF1127 domain-containing protein [Pseudomonadota bacterium]
MTDQQLGPLLALPPQSQIDQYFAGLGFGINPYLESQGRQRMMAYLNALSDRDLAHLGITREDITAYCFRHRFAAA